MPTPGPGYWQRRARFYAQREGLPADVFLRQLKMEAGFRTNATSPAGARGIAQIMPFHDVRPDLPGHQVAGKNPEWDLAWSARHNAQNLRKYGNVKDMLSVYNSGRPWSQGRNISETRNYVNKILGGSSGAQMKVPRGGSAQTTAFQAEPHTVGATPKQGVMQFLMANLANYAATGQNLGPMDLYAMTRMRAVDVPQAGEFEDTPQTPRGSVGRAGSLMPGGKGLTYGGGHPTHETAGLPGYPAKDVFGKPGTAFVAPEAGRLYRYSGRGGTSGQIYGWSAYFRGQSGKDYFITHLNKKRAALGRYRKGAVLGTISPWSGGSPHAHVGVRG